MKSVVFATIVSLLSIVVQTQISLPTIPEECFRYSDAYGDPVGQAVNNQDQLLSDEFRHDMRLKKILGCTSDTLLGLTFTVESPTKSLELDSLGYRYGSRCSPVIITDDQFLKYLEISFNSRKVNAFFAKLGGNVNILYGTPGPLD